MNRNFLVSCLVPVISLMLLASCQMFDDEGQKKVRSFLKDPGSAQFRNTRNATYESKSVYCGEVNAKNSMGAFTGFVRYIVEGNAVFIGDEANIYQDTQSTEIQKTSASLTIHTARVRTNNMNLEEKIRQQEANVKNPAIGTKSLGEGAWEYYCETKDSERNSPERQCDKDFEYAKNVYSNQMTDGDYKQASRVKIPTSCKTYQRIIDEVSALASNAKLNNFLEIAASKSDILSKRTYAISGIKTLFPEEASKRASEITTWEADIKKQHGRKFSGEECTSMAMLVPSVALDIGMKRNAMEILTGAKNSKFPQAYDAMLKWVTQYDVPSLLRYSNEMGADFEKSCINGKIRNGFEKKSK